jgi:hypothetical protein
MPDIRLPVTTREALRARAGACTHLNYSDGVYHDDQDIPQQIIDWGLGLIRTRASGSAQQRAAFETLADAGVGLYLDVGDMTYDVGKIAADIDLCAARDALVFRRRVPPVPTRERRACHERRGDRAATGRLRGDAAVAWGDGLDDRGAVQD